MFILSTRSDDFRPKKYLDGFVSPFQTSHYLTAYKLFKMVATICDGALLVAMLIILKTS